jgi:hypothetical protein
LGRHKFSVQPIWMVTMANKTYYEILDVPPIASQEEIEKQGHFLIQLWHPDKFRNSDEQVRAAEMFKEINEAYTELRDPVKRRSYDWKIKVAQATGMMPEGQEEQKIPPHPIQTSTPSPIVAALLSFFILGGAGQIYIGQVTKGVVLIVASFILSIFGIGIVIWFVGCIDAYILADRKSKGEAVVLE